MIEKPTDLRSRTARPPRATGLVVALVLAWLGGGFALSAADEPAEAVAEEEEEELVITGRMEGDAVLHFSPEFEEGAAAYEPDPLSVELIASNDVELEIEVVWASWCSDSTREVPRFLKILERAEESRASLGLGPLPIRVAFVAVDRDKRSGSEDLAADKGIEMVPTFLIVSGDREVGRIVETPEGALEEDLALRILEAALPPEAAPVEGGAPE